ncbi:PREDICTED: ewing's tumor-associated antigen 1-like [Elephantulus edwardii]|uniref:ewing's tumor-associated antigen 1-like n=1 Tax=Elephantulus edwardii TaxID=28737 RepID=UPI0003F0B554|nr:PREDICTED: ewing's tumor-associated antigen 1-like [Elephantulus edwardii]
MSRRRKHGEGSGPKDSPRKPEECGSLEPGRRRLRSSRGSGPRGAGEVLPQPVWQQGQLPAAADCSKSNPEERYETPKRTMKMDFLPSPFCSPNDPDGLNDIFWDQNSPMTKQLGKGRKKQNCITDNDEISHIVNRIAPQDEKPTTNSLLGVWIGETAIPCTPTVAKGKSRAKMNCAKLKAQNQEEELMKLAKQFDKNMEELGVIQEQNYGNHDFTQVISETETVNDYKDNMHMQSSCHMVPGISSAVVPVKENATMSIGNDLSNCPKSFDQSVEAAFNAIFDGSTQKCSGQLSQDPPNVLLNTGGTTFAKKNKEEKIVTKDTLVTVKLQSQTPESFSSLVDTPVMTKPCRTSCAKELNMHIDPFATSDFEEDWDTLLRNDPFMMPELLPVPKTTHGAVPKDTDTCNRKNDQSKSVANTKSEVRLGDTKILHSLPSKTCNTDLIDSVQHKYLPDSNNNPNQLSSTKHKMRFGETYNKVLKSKIQDCDLASSITKIKDVPPTFSPVVNTSENKFSPNTRYFHEPKNKLIFNQSFNIDLFGSGTSASGTKPDSKTNAPNSGPFFDDWNDASFANEIIEACRQVEDIWETDTLDDDLLYKACDDIERLTQQQDVRNESKTSRSTVEISSSEHGAKNVFTISEQETRLGQSKHLNLGNIALQTSPLAISSQINMVEERKTCRNPPSILSAKTSLTLHCKNSDDDISNLHGSWTNTNVPVKVNSSKLVLGGNSSLNMSSVQIGKGIRTAPQKSNAQHLSHRLMGDETQADRNKTVKFSKYTFTKTKNSQIGSPFNQNCAAGSMSDTDIIYSLEGNKISCVNSARKEDALQHQSVMTPEFLKQPSKEDDEKNRKCSPEEIQKKRQEALVRRMRKARASSLNAAPT